MKSSQTDVTIRKKSESRLERWLSHTRPGLGVVATAILLLAGVLAILKYAQLESPPFGIDRALVLLLVVGFWALLWPLVALITHLLGLRFELRGSFLKLLRISGRAWILNLLAMIVWDTVELVFLSLEWTLVADLWDSILGSGLLWVILYPAAVKSAYGPSARSCLMTFLAWAIALALGVSVMEYCLGLPVSAQLS
jgi:hypothetical protein